MSELELMRASQQTAADLTTDLNSVYGRRAASLFRMNDVNRKKTTAPAATKNTWPWPTKTSDRL